ncbi:type II inositol polyphosphate 5-phosphatase 15-like isoform X2 [Rhodamnia argentea]|uniref:Type II inositol polyphosphate 5-phosphatase 15-like isoform X2 n=1 Tax=Rhodamnia argentea TaxID=178133 RepID=A0A8B8Q2V5_9MYRT|nr:type II inositol polyphosphate 5-phosphatase 15-like isoform X2 [Rhodamnia argentea]
MSDNYDFDLLTGPTTSTTTPPLSQPFFSPHFESSEEEGEDDGGGGGDGAEAHRAISSTTKRLDYMLQFLDRKLSTSSSFDAPPAGDTLGGERNSKGSAALPEFVGRGGGAGVFKLPVRAAVHPGRPPCVELRPHPLRETQIGRSLGTLVATPSQLWAGGERSVRVWDLTADIFAAAERGEGVDAEADTEPDTVPYRESMGGISPALCLVADEASQVVWSGHQDGRVRCWSMSFGSSSVAAACSSKKTRFKEALSWQAHRGPVLSVVISSYGDLWSGSEGGVIKIWPWEAIEKSLSLTVEERHLATSIVDRSYIDPLNYVNTNGFCNSLAADVKHLFSDNYAGKVWSFGNQSFALWDARTRELLNVYSVDGQVESRGDISALQDSSMDYFSSQRKEKTQSSFGFFQRSRNVILGAADAVRRVATKGAFGDDSRRTEALVTTIDGMVWTGCASGLLIQWDGNGNRLQDFQYHSFPVQCLCTFGHCIWVGYASGSIHVLDLEGNLLGGWVAYSSPVLKLAVGAGYVFSLAKHGGIRGWSITSPGPIDSILRSELAGKEFLYSRIENMKILAGTWNVGQERASRDSLISWLGSAASDANIVVVGLQEVEMGAGFLAVSAAKETVGLEGSAVGQWWLDMIGKTLNEGSTFERMGSRQLAGLLIAMWVRNTLKPHAGDVDAAAVPCGFGRTIGNKGAVGLRMRVYDRIMCFVNCHFAAHAEAVARRNDDFDHVYRSMTFTRASTFSNVVTVGASSAVQVLRGTNGAFSQSAEVMPELSEADLVIFLGDFNYRLDGITYDEARDFVSQRCFDWLREKDQLRVEMEAGNVFQGMREAVVKFPPTYKFERHQAGLAGYDSSEKKRIPAWCDRILYRDSRSALESECSLECPVVSSVVRYEACMDVTDSDHKPVRCMFNVDIARVDESARRQEFGEVVAQNERVKTTLKGLFMIPETIVSTNNIILQNQDTSILRITNKSGNSDALFQIICEGVSMIKDDGQALDHRPRASFGFPQWLRVSPVSGIIKPEHTTEVSVHHEKFQTVEEFVDGVPQNWWCEDNRDREVVLEVRVSSSYMTETRNHRIRVRYCISSKGKQVGDISLNSKQAQANLLDRSNLQRLSDSYDLVDHFRNLHSP